MVDCLFNAFTPEDREMILDAFAVTLLQLAADGTPSFERADALKHAAQHNVGAKLPEKAIQYIRASKRIEMISLETSSASENAVRL